MHPPFARLTASVCLLAASYASTTLAARPTAELLPNTTRGHLSIVDSNTLKTQWEQTQLAELIADPSMEPFADSLRDQFDSNLSVMKQYLGLTLEDLEGIPNGEMSLSLVNAESGPAIVVLVDVTDNLVEAAGALATAEENLIDRGATKSVREIDGTKVMVFDIPPDPDRNLEATTAAYFTHSNFLAAANDVDALADILKRFEGEHEDTLAATDSYQALLRRCRADADGLLPNVVWYVDPIPYAEAMRVLVADPNVDRRGETDYVQVLSNQGFKAVQAVGGFINFAVNERVDILHRTAIYAPKPFEKAMRMLDFPNVDDLRPASWVPDTVALHITMNVNIREAFENSATLVDELFGEGEEDILEAIIADARDDPNGPGIDIRKDLIWNLGNRVTIIVDYEIPITATSERILIAIETTDADALATAIRRSLETDPVVIRHEFQGHELWEIVEGEAEDLPPVDINLDGFGLDEEETDEEQKIEGDLLANTIITVAHGQLFIASRLELLKEVVSQPNNPLPLGPSPDYVLVENELKALGFNQASIRIFQRMDEMARPAYEQMKAGEMPTSESVLGRFLNGVFGSEDPDEVREQKIDASKLPEFDIVRRYLGPSGAFCTTEQDGWFIVGCTLNKNAH